MPSFSTYAAEAFAVLRQIIRTHLRSIVPLAAAVFVGIIVVAALVGIYAQLIGGLAYEQLVASATTAASASAITVVMMLPVALLGVVLTLVWAGIAVQIASAAITGRRISPSRAAFSSLRRAPRLLVVLMFVALVVIGAAALAPVLLVLGVLGLLLRSRAVQSRFAARWPSRGTLIAMAVPFGVAVLLLVRWSLAPASVWLAGTGVRAALSDSAARVRSHEAAVGLSLILAAVLNLAVTEGLLALFGVGGTYIDVAVRVIAIVLVGPVLFVASAVHYRRGGVENGLSAGPPAAPAVPGGVSRRARIAVAVMVSLLFPLVVSGSPEPANAVTGPGADESRTLIQATPRSPLPADTDIDIDIAVDNPNTGESMRPTGEISITIDGEAQTGPFELDTFSSSYVFSSSFAVGSHVIKSVYAGDANYAPSSDLLTIVAGYAGTLTLEPTATTAVYGAANTLTAALSTTGADATGSVEFSARLNNGPTTVIGTALITGGVATFDAAALPLGSYSLSAQYLGDDTHIPAWIGYTALTVTRASTQTSFSITPTTPSVAGATLTAHIRVAATDSLATPEGSADVYLDESGSSLGHGALAGGAVDVDFTLSPGVNQTVTVRFAGDAEFLASSHEISHTVTAHVAGVALEASAATTVSGENLRLTATVTAGSAPTGTVDFTAIPLVGDPVTLGSAALDGTGVAVLDTAALPVGEFSIIAGYAGNDSVNAGESPGVAHFVDKSRVTVRVDSDTLVPEYGAEPTLTVTVGAVAPGAGVPQGTVTVLLDSAVLETATLDSSGVATLAVAPGDAGDHTLTVDYVGDGSFEAGSGALDLTVVRLETATYLPGTDLSAVYGGTSFMIVIGAQGKPSVTATGVNGWFLAWHVQRAVDVFGIALDSGAAVVGVPEVISSGAADSTVEQNFRPNVTFSGVTGQAYVIWSRLIQADSATNVALRAWHVADGVPLVSNTPVVEPVEPAIVPAVSADPELAATGVNALNLMGLTALSVLALLGGLLLVVRRRLTA